MTNDKKMVGDIGKVQKDDGEWVKTLEVFGREMGLTNIERTYKRTRRSSQPAVTYKCKTYCKVQSTQYNKVGEDGVDTILHL